MLPTTSVKCVRLFASTSFVSQQANISFLMLACCFLITSELPLTATVFTVALLLKYHSKTNWLAEPIQGRLVFSSANSCEVDGEPIEIQRSVLSLAGFGILIWLKGGGKRMIWRDSVKEEHYRQLLVMLKREH
ncbi:protein YgfX [Vibrio coralliilyticus]|uniref:protein YgfX n=1 Tax=Vibrio coralliilyticus TaxID=190893 RepID=UPI00345E4D60